MEKTRARRQRRRRRRRRHHFLRLSVCLSLSLAKMRASNEPNDEEDEEGGKRGEALSFSVCALTESSPRTLDENAEKRVWRRRSARVLHTAVFYSLA